MSIIENVKSLFTGKSQDPAFNAEETELTPSSPQAARQSAAQTYVKIAMKTGKPVPQAVHDLAEGKLTDEEAESRGIGVSSSADAKKRAAQAYIKVASELGYPVPQMIRDLAEGTKNQIYSDEWVDNPVSQRQKAARDYIKAMSGLNQTIPAEILDMAEGKMGAAELYDEPEPAQTPLQKAMDIYLNLVQKGEPVPLGIRRMVEGEKVVYGATAQMIREEAGLSPTMKRRFRHNIIAVAQGYVDIASHHNKPVPSHIGELAELGDTIDRYSADAELVNALYSLLMLKQVD